MPSRCERRHREDKGFYDDHAVLYYDVESAETDRRDDAIKRPRGRDGR